MAVRIAALYLASTLLLLLLLGGGLYLGTERALVESRRQDLQALAAGDAAFLERAVGTEDDLLTLAPVIVTTLPHTPATDRSVRIFSANGTMLAAVPPGAQGGSQRPSQAVLDRLPLGLLSLTLTPADRPGQIYAAAPIQGTSVAGGQATIGVVEAAQSRGDIDGVLQQVAQTFALAAGVVALLAVGAALALGRVVTRPIRRLEAVAAAVAGGDLGRRATHLPRNEIGALGASFNHMAERLAGSLAEARAEQARLAALLASLADGVLACDAAGRLTLENPAARRLLGLAPDADLAAVREAAAAAGIAGLWRRAMGDSAAGDSGRPVEAEIPLQSSVLLALAVPIAGGGAVCVLRDITRVRELEQSRAAVLSRLGHELRTPLTALRTVLANLSDTAAPETAAPFAAAEAEAARLARLVEEILAWSRGRTVAQLDLRPTDLTGLARATCALFAGRAARLGVTLQAPAAAPAVVVRGDTDRLRQVLVNLLDNGLRHTPPGGTVTVGLAVDAGTAVLEVRDTGAGMTPEQSRWAFEPYYQAAPGPDGQTAEGAPPGEARGQSGLGLAIVREIVAAHGGQVTLESRPGAGTTVRIRLPLAALSAPAAS